MSFPMFFKYPLKLFIKITPFYGEKQKKIHIAHPGHDVCNYLKPGHGATVGIMSYNFPKSEWEDESWLRWLKEQNQKQVSIKVVGGPEIEAKKSLDKLISEGIVKARKLSKPKTFHILFVSTPKQLWIESYHKNRHARDVYYTDSPYEQTWESTQKIFNKFWESGEDIVP